MSATPPRAAPVQTTVDTTVRVLGQRRTPLRDVYHGFLLMPWWASLTSITAVYLLLNAGFALGYVTLGGVANAHPGSFADAFYFSVQTMGTIGYGAMYPTHTAANLLVVAESVTSLLITALATGLLFAKFSRPSARVVFSRELTIAPIDGVPTLMLRAGNERSSLIVEAMVRVALIRTEISKEGMTFYRMHDLTLTRDRSPAFTRSWTAMHPITPTSPLYGQTPASVHAAEVEIVVSIVGTDETLMQAVHARHRYLDTDIIWGARHADILSEDATGQFVLDLRKFHDVMPTTPTADFPYPAP